ncbi:MAG: exodeoxyribonuclease VII large subunit [Bacteroidota bacterium]
MSEYRLSELHTFIRRFVALNLPEAVWIQAELADLDERRGHYYLSLVEKAQENDQPIAQGQAIMWSRQAKRWQRQQGMLLPSILQAGRELKLQVQVEFHERYGLSMQIVDIDPNYTLGQLAQKRQATIDYLQQTGLLEANRQQQLPLAPQRLAIISSPAAAGLQDFLGQLHDNSYGYEFKTQLFPAAVQGPQTSPEVRRQLRTIERRREDYDAIVIIRGGGAKMDLADFDERELCISAAQTKLPIITGIGHETDQSIMDMLAHTALKTPTATADFLVERLLKMDQYFAMTAQRLDLLQRHHIGQAENTLLQISNQLRLREQQLIERQKWQLQQYTDQLPLHIRTHLAQARRKLQELEKLHEVLSLEAHLKRGFSVLSQAGRIINRTDEIDQQQAVRARLSDGTIDLETKTNPGTDEG